MKKGKIHVPCFLPSFFLVSCPCIFLGASTFRLTKVGNWGLERPWNRFLGAEFLKRSWKRRKRVEIAAILKKSSGNQRISATKFPAFFPAYFKNFPVFLKYLIRVWLSPTSLKMGQTKAQKLRSAANLERIRSMRETPEATLHPSHAGRPDLLLWLTHTHVVDFTF